MKDLYLQLGIDPNASPADIEAALQAKPELSGAAEVLLNESRRSAYNRTVSTIRSIGMLRHRLGLDAERTWFVATCPDFAPRLHIRKYVNPPESPAATAAESTAVETETAQPASRKGKPWVKVVFFMLAVAALLALLRSFL